MSYLCIIDYYRTLENYGNAHGERPHEVEIAFRVVLHTATVCTIRKVESDAFQVLVVLVNYVSVPMLSEEKLGKKESRQKR